MSAPLPHLSHVFSLVHLSGHITMLLLAGMSCVSSVRQLKPHDLTIKTESAEKGGVQKTDFVSYKQRQET